MKKFLLTIIALLTINTQTIHAMDQSPKQLADNDFEVMMAYDWDSTPTGQQYAVDRSWQDWTTDQKNKILLRLKNQGLMTEADVKYWQAPRPNQIPQARFEPIGG